VNPTDALRDIRGLDAIAWWPPAPGWWVFAIAAAAAVLLVWIRRRRGWKREARELLRALRGRMAREDPRRLAGELSEILRRIAMVRFGRHACAGLAGGRWLAWLEVHDPRRFPWSTRGRALVDLPYAPDDGVVDPAVLPPLIQAAEAWVVAGATAGGRGAAAAPASSPGV